MAETGNFSIPKEIFTDERLSMRDRGVLCTVCSLPKDWEFNIVKISEFSADGKEAIRSSLIKLEELGYITRIKTRDELGRFHSYVEVFPGRN